MMNADLMGAFLVGVFYELLAYTAGLLLCFGVVLVVLRSVDRMLSEVNPEERR